MRVHDSQAYRKMDVTRERISRVLELREILLSIQIGFSLVIAAVACASWIAQASQPQRITSGLKTNFSLSPSYSLFNCKTFHTKSLNNSSKTLHTNITSTHFIFYKTRQPLARNQKLFPESLSERVTIKISLRNISF